MRLRSLYHAIMQTVLVILNCTRPVRVSKSTLSPVLIKLPTRAPHLVTINLQDKTRQKNPRGTQETTMIALARETARLKAL